MTLQGIDVSASGQGTAFNWTPYKGKVSFAFTKVSESTNYGDPSAARNIAQMRAEKIVAGGYHFLHAGVSGSAQAEAFLSHAKAAGLRAGDLMAVDAEDFGLDLTDAQRNDPKAVAAAMARMDQVAYAFATEVRKHFPGFWPILYTEISLAPHMISNGSCPLWLANPSGMAVKSIGAWKGGPSFEQTGDRYVDTDVFYGTPAELAKLAIR